MITRPPFHDNPIPISRLRNHWSYPIPPLRLMYGYPSIRWPECWFPGVYMIYNRVTKRMYVGASQDVRKRWSAHRSGMRYHNRFNVPPQMQADHDAHGEGSFFYVILEECDNRTQLRARERFWFHQIHPDPKTNSGYNGSYYRAYEIDSVP